MTKFQNVFLSVTAVIMNGFIIFNSQHRSVSTLTSTRLAFVDTKYKTKCGPNCTSVPTHCFTTVQLSTVLCGWGESSHTRLTIFADVGSLQSVIPSPSGIQTMFLQKSTFFIQAVNKKRRTVQHKDLFN